MVMTSEKRAWLQAQGYTVSDHGKLSDTLTAAYDAAHPAPNGEPPPPPATDYPDDDFESAFADEPAADDDESFATGETPPRRPKASSRPGRARGLLSGWQRNTGTKRSPAKKKHPRKPVEGLISRGWGLAARLARPMPPVSRILQIQAPVAGILLEDAVKGTIVDTVLQPLARWEEKGKVFGALAGPPALVGMITVHLAQAAAAETDPNPVFMSLATEMLEESLFLYADVVGDRFDEILAKVEARERDRDKIQRMIAFLFSPPPDVSDADAVAAEEASIRRAQGLLREETAQ